VQFVYTFEISQKNVYITFTFSVYIFCLHSLFTFFMIIVIVHVLLVFFNVYWKCKQNMNIYNLHMQMYKKMDIKIIYLHFLLTFCMYIFFVHFLCTLLLFRLWLFTSNFKLYILNLELEIWSTNSLSHCIYIWSYASVETVFAQTVHGPKTIVLHTLLLLVGKKLRDRDGYFELFSRKNFGYYDLLKSGTITDKL
jgi:hypothetical protein